jgi:uncharacterized protein
MVLGAELRCIAGLALLELGFLSLLFLGGRQCGNEASRRKLGKRDWHLSSALFPDEFEQREKFGAVGERKSMRKHLPVACFLAIISSSLPAHAIDCTKASRGDEKAICADPVLKTADERLNQTYERIWRARSADERKGLEALQRDWITGRNDCPHSNDTTDARCLLGKIEERRAFLVRAEGVGPERRGRLTYLAIDKPAIVERDTALHVSAFRFANARSAGERLFNTEINRQIEYQETEVSFSDTEGEKRLCAGDDKRYGCNFENSFRMPQPFLTDEFISAPIDTWFYSGGAHGGGNTVYINIDLVHGKIIDMKDLFDKKAGNKVVVLCRKNFDAHGGEDLNLVDEEDYERDDHASDTFSSTVRDLQSWSFSKDRATVLFGLYVLGPYAAGEQICTLPYADLRPLLKPGKVLPP